MGRGRNGKIGEGVDWIGSAEASGWQEFRKVRLEGKTSASRELGEESVNRQGGGERDRGRWGKGGRQEIQSAWA